MWKRLSGLVCLSFLFVMCTGEDNNKRQRTIDPASIKIDVEVGGVLTPDQVLLQFKKTGAGSKVLLVPNATFLAEDFKVLENEFVIVYYDMRNRGRSQPLNGPGKLRDGILNDVRDMEAVRQHFQFEQVYLVGHGYLAAVAALYARQYPQYTSGIVMVNPVSPDGRGAAPTADSLDQALRGELAGIETQRAEMENATYCREWWNIQKKLMVADPINAKKIRVDICRYPNEQPDRVSAYQRQYILPTLWAQDFSANGLSAIEMPVLIIRGARDRMTSQAGAEAWEKSLPNASLEVLEDAGHFPWVEQDIPFFEAIRAFIDSAE